MALRMLARNLFQRVPASQATVLQRTGSLALPKLQQAAWTGFLVAPQPLKLGRTFGRAFAVSAVSKEASKDLSAALAEEIEYERENNKQEEEDVQPPGDWILTEEPGDSVITLTRKHNGEEILVEFSVNDQPNGDEMLGDEEIAQDEEPQVDLAINFDASVIKGDKALSFDLTSDGTFLEVNHVGLGSADQEPDDDDYDGPVYSELDDKVQQLFQNYLDERGINAQMGEYLLAVADNKEQREYVKWLGDVKGFLDKKA